MFLTLYPFQQHWAAALPSEINCANHKREKSNFFVSGFWRFSTRPCAPRTCWRAARSSGSSWSSTASSDLRTWRMRERIRPTTWGQWPSPLSCTPLSSERPRDRRPTRAGGGRGQRTDGWRPSENRPKSGNLPSGPSWRRFGKILKKKKKFLSIFFRNDNTCHFHCCKKSYTEHFIINF